MSGKYGINRDEWFPVYFIDPVVPQVSDEVYEIPDELVERYYAALEEWEAIQSELDKIYDK